MNSTRLLGLALLVTPAFAQDVDLAISYVDAFPGQDRFERPIYIDHHPKDPGHYWVVEQGGLLSRIPADGESDEREVVLDLTEVCLHPGDGGGNEEGLLGFAFAPGYGETNRHVFVYYSSVKQKQGRRIVRESVLSRFTIKDTKYGPEADTLSELIVMRVDQPWSNHNGGTIVVGPDQMLYVALGDGGAANDRGKNGQNLGTLLGTVLRIDVSEATEDEPYRVPADNPFVGRDDARPEIWAYGLRNPWRISFDRETGALWCADVGQNKYEEIDIIVKGGNYGWPIREAFHAFPDTRDGKDDPKTFVEPIAEYPHEEGLSVTGGYVYRGKTMPKLRGHFVYGDFVTMRMWAAAPAESDGANHAVMRLTKAPGPIAAFGEEPNGEILVLCFDGKIYRMVSGS